ncbi:MAG: alginate export family protein [Candidatus Omnitrophica bacterium]|nr:alginate export family protein [Candidatus Omnitrophota bacterium]
MKHLKALFVLALALGFAAPAFAETQNVKINGSLDVYAIARGNYDLASGNDVAADPAAGAFPASGTLLHRSDGDEFIMSITQLGIAADLTDGVSTVVNLINQRDWNADTYGTAGTAQTGAENTGEEFDVILDLAYAQMKEIFYAPLTLTIGRQDLLFGRGFIVGWNPQDPTTAIQADEFTQVQSFDALRATLDFSPWTVDFVYSKITENNHGPEDDRDLYVAYTTYKFAEYNAVADLYYTGDFDRSAGNISGAVGTRSQITHTFGVRGQFDPISQMTLGAEIAYQGGDYSVSASTPNRDRTAWGLDIFGEYRFEGPWKPVGGIQFVSLSGENDLSSGTGDYSSWNGSFRGPIYGWYHDYKEVYYSTAQTNDQVAGQNQNHVSLYGSLNPMDDLKLTGAFWHFWSDEDMHTTTTDPNTGSLSDHIGDEVDLSAIYSYTEDVTFTFMANWFIPGSSYDSANDSTASEFVSEVKVVF